MAGHTKKAAQNPIRLIFERIHDITNLTDSRTLTPFRFLKRCRRASPHLSLWKLFEWSRRRHRHQQTPQQTNFTSNTCPKHDGAVRPAKRTAAVLLLLLSCFHEHKVSQSTAVVEKVAA